jgi:tetratricopeptide (TPR) repeat protein
MPVKFRVRELKLDPHFLAVRWTPEYRAEALALAGYTRGRYKLSQGQQAEAEAEFKAALEKLTVPDLYSARFLVENALSSILFSRKNWKEAKNHLEAALASPTRRADLLPSTYLRLARVSRELGDNELMRRSADAAITTDAAVENRSGVSETLRVLRINP